MPDPPIKPPNKRVDELVTQITEEMWGSFEIKDHISVRNDKIVTFLIRQIAENRAIIEMLNEKNT